jgi:hypothetical protein
MRVATADQITAPPTVAEVRARLFDGLASVSVFAEAVNRAPRQIACWVAQGLPPSGAISSNPQRIAA